MSPIDFALAPSDPPTLSLVLPIFNESEVIPELGARLSAFLEPLKTTWEVVFVDDGSTDHSVELLKTLCQAAPQYRLVSLSRNFGHQLAITAGLDYARGRAVVVMDADLQDPPEVIAEMLQKFEEGFDIVHAVRKKREREGWFKRGTAYLFYRLLRAVVGVPIPLDAGDFRLMSRRAVLTLRALREVQSIRARNGGLGGLSADHHRVCAPCPFRRRDSLSVA